MVSKKKASTQSPADFSAAFTCFEKFILALSPQRLCKSAEYFIRCQQARVRKSVLAAALARITDPACRQTVALRPGL